ncbi:hypothetical protein PEC18_19330 [Paucibacter sp. O1-1]|nr:hypothetical protein [Paucibacter sp. O1-1]MDA3827940.1 hypothetical protein [Paucibacter sp. O1-1]
MDEDRALERLRRDREVDVLYKEVSAMLVDLMQRQSDRVPAALDLLWCARALERIGDRCKNLCEQVIYLVRGKDVRHTGLSRTSGDAGKGDVRRVRDIHGYKYIQEFVRSADGLISPIPAAYPVNSCAAVFWTGFRDSSCCRARPVHAMLRPLRTDRMCHKSVRVGTATPLFSVPFADSPLSVRVRHRTCVLT